MGTDVNGGVFLAFFYIVRGHEWIVADSWQNMRTALPFNIKYGKWHRNLCTHNRWEPEFQVNDQEIPIKVAVVPAANSWDAYDRSDFLISWIQMVFLVKPAMTKGFDDLVDKWGDLVLNPELKLRSLAETYIMLICLGAFGHSSVNTKITKGLEGTEGSHGGRYDYAHVHESTQQRVLVDSILSHTLSHNACNYLGNSLCILNTRLTHIHFNHQGTAWSRQRRTLETDKPEDSAQAKHDKSEERGWKKGSKIKHSKFSLDISNWGCDSQPVDDTKRRLAFKLWALSFKPECDSSK